MIWQKILAVIASDMVYVILVSGCLIISVTGIKTAY